MKRILNFILWTFCGCPRSFGTEYIGLYLSLASTATSTAISYNAAQEQKQVVKDQGEANAKAVEQEATRKAAEAAENTRRAAIEQRRFRASQTAQMASTGLRLDTGSPLSIAADTITSQQRELGDISYGSSVDQRAMGWQAEQYRSGAMQQARAIGQQQAAGLISGIGDMAYAGFKTGSKAYNSYYGNVVDRNARGL